MGIEVLGSNGKEAGNKVVYTCPVCRKGILKHVFEEYNQCPYCGTPFRKAALIEDIHGYISTISLDVAKAREEAGLCKILAIKPA